jgi:hypothetical protein
MEEGRFINTYKQEHAYNLLISLRLSAKKGFIYDNR